MGPLTLVVVTALVLGVAWLGYRQWTTQQQVNAAWRKIGRCAPISASSDTVTCTGVRTVDLPLPRGFAACAIILAKQSTCTAPVNVEAAPYFRRAVADIDAAGLGRYVTRFETVNRRRCKDARTGGYIPNCVSRHSYGVAVDLRPFEDNAKWNAVVAAEPGLTRVITIFERNGFTWGMHFAGNPDPQHVEWRP
jgi:D-alanyl-D-alanine carboxypeptidase